MAIQTKLGRVQGAGVFVTTAEAYSGANQQYVSRSSIFPTEDRGVKPFVGDTIIFANGIVGIISDVQSSSSIRCTTNSLFSLKGKDGLNITKVEQTTTSTESGGINVVTFTLSDGSKYNVQIANGQEGGSGVDGLIVKQEGDENILYLTKADETFGEGIPLPKGGGSGGGSTNFILNPDFSVNQRGQEEYTGTQTVDCFEQNTVEGYNVKSIPTADGVELVVKGDFGESRQPEQGKALFTQAIEDAKKLEGKTVTLSVNASVATQEGGTAVPNDGTFVENIYFNTALSADEVVSILSTLTYIDIGQTTDVSLLACKSDASLSICAGHNKENGSYTLVDLIADDGIYWFDSTTGWNADFNGTLLFNGETIAELEGVPIGAGNDKLVDIFSITPNFGSAKGELMLGYTSESEGGGASGTPVPNDGTVVQNIYLNTSLSIDETVAIMQKVANWTPLNEAVSAYFVASDATGAKGLAMFTMGGIYGLSDFSVFTTGQGNIYFTSQPVADFGISTAGWQGISYCAFNDTTVSLAQGMSAGEENSKLIDLFSTTPSFGSGSSSGGTPVPNDGSLVETVYFNTAKTEAEWAAVASQLNFVEGFTDLPVYPVLVTTNGEALAVVHQTSLGRYFLGVSNMVTGTETMIFVPNSFSDGSPSVWQVSNYVFNANSQSVVQGVPVGTQNDLLIDFISTTPEFGSPSSGGASGEFIPLVNGMNSLTFKAKWLKECGIYSSSNMIGTMPKYIGTPVPNDGSSVDKVYFNTSLPTDKVVEILSSLSYPAAGMYNYVFVAEDESKSIVVEKKHTDSDGTRYRIWDMVDGTHYFSSSSMAGDGIVGWYDFGGVIEVGKNAGSLEGISVGTSNGKLASLIAITPFELNPDYYDAKAVIHSIKLELGEEATAHLPTVTNDEKVRCQRVYQPVSLNGVVGYAKDESTLAVSIPLPVSMRALPSVESFETISILGGAEVTDVAVDGIENNSVQLSLTTSGLTTSSLYMVSDGKVCLSADEFPS